MIAAGRCPHADITDCPLYRASHIPAIAHLGCDDGHMATGGCAVDRGVSYAARVNQAIELLIRFLHDRADDIARRLSPEAQLKRWGNGDDSV